MPTNDKNKNEQTEQQKKYGGQNDRWPGEPPIPPAPGTETDGPEEGEKTFVPIVR